MYCDKRSMREEKGMFLAVGQGQLESLSSNVVM